MTNAHSKDTLDDMSSTLMGIFQMHTKKIALGVSYPSDLDSVGDPHAQ